ncbi:hypothetical protein KIPB_003892 [Kipferlia bialata]|uniref:UBC core domain-containing protein n=1 Tax=Kipferlia bialata TaxID=797122 RepID=A0A9K3GHC6_9EUKA|nr:hypothetical protein KIPB_003892 [Kipferlia bialata]|eukprot:g3892.t1
MRQPLDWLCLDTDNDELLEWHFSMLGPPDSVYEEGLYHGRITFPSEYPHKPPTLTMLTRSGRFEVGKKICMSNTAYHPESWQPAWGMRTMLTALRSFFEEETEGAVGYIKGSALERRLHATQSKGYRCSQCKMCHKELYDGVWKCTQTERDALKPSPPHTSEAEGETEGKTETQGSEKETERPAVSEPPRPVPRTPTHPSLSLPASHPSLRIGCDTSTVCSSPSRHSTSSTPSISIPSQSDPSCAPPASPSLALSPLARELMRRRRVRLGQ